MVFHFLPFCLNNTKYSSKWKSCRVWWNRQHWNVNWLHRRFRYRHHQHHCITIRRDRFGHTNSISNHFRSVRRSTGELKFDIWFSRFFFIASTTTKKETNVCREIKLAIMQLNQLSWSRFFLFVSKRRSMFIECLFVLDKLCDAVRLWLVMIPSSKSTQKRNNLNQQNVDMHRKNPFMLDEKKNVFFGLNFIRLKWSRLPEKTQSGMQSVQFRDHLHLHALTLIGLYV